jgi:hypothetical protein
MTELECFLVGILLSASTHIDEEDPRFNFGAWMNFWSYAEGSWCVATIQYKWRRGTYWWFQD